MAHTKKEKTTLTIFGGAISVIVWLLADIPQAFITAQQIIKHVPEWLNDRAGIQLSLTGSYIACVIVVTFFIVILIWIPWDFRRVLTAREIRAGEIASIAGELAKRGRRIQRNKADWQLDDWEGECLANLQRLCKRSAVDKFRQAGMTERIALLYQAAKYPEDFIDGVAQDATVPEHIQWPN
jgi:hypothetical protein